MEKNMYKSFSALFDIKTGLTKDMPPIKRYLSEMKGMYHDIHDYEKKVKNGNPMVYEFFNSVVPEQGSDLIFGTSIVYPGKIGNEFFMTKGHFHTILNTAETYFCINGHGYMLMESKEGITEVQEMKQGTAVYVPPGFAHRSINISEDEILVTFFTFRADAGHEYGSIEKKGFRKLVVSQDNQVRVIDNPNWK